MGNNFYSGWALAIIPLMAWLAIFITRRHRWRGFKFEKGGKNGELIYTVRKNGNVLITIRQDLIDISAQEIDSWYEYLNIILGVTSLGFALAVQGTPNPPLNAFICLMFLLISHFAFNFNKFPKHLKSLRTENKTAYRFLATKIEGMQLSVWKTFARAPLFLIGYLYLLLLVVMALKFVQDFTVMDHTLANIFLPKDCVCRFPAK